MDFKIPYDRYLYDLPDPIDYANYRFKDGELYSKTRL